MGEGSPPPNKWGCPVEVSGQEFCDKGETKLMEADVQV
jgi:hypothetical protein